jgi:hypothetical protein
MTEQDRPTEINPEALTGKSNPPRMGSGGNPIMVDNDNENAHGLKTPEEIEVKQAEVKDAVLTPEQKQAQRERAIREQTERDVYAQFGYEPPRNTSRREGNTPEEKRAARETAKRLGASGEKGVEKLTIPTGDWEETQEIEISTPEAELEERMLNAMARDRERNANIDPAQVYKKLKDVYKFYETNINDGSEHGEKKKIAIDSEELLIKSFRKDLGWNAVIKTLLSQKESLGLQQEFVQDLEAAQKIILDIWAGKRLGNHTLKEVQDLFEKLTNGTVGKEKSSIHEYVFTYEPLRRDIIPLCIEDLGRIIMDSASEEYRTGESHAIINEDGKFQAHNFLAWCRDRAYWYHDQFSDGEIDLFSNISVSTMYRTISLGEMINGEKYFMTRDTHKMNLGEGYGTTEAYVHDEELKNLRDLALYEMWLFGLSHNYDVKYRHTMGNEGELPKAMMEIFATNGFTKNKMRFLKVLMLTGNNEKQLDLAIRQRTKEGNLIKTEDQEVQGTVGQGIRKAILAYYYLCEIDNFDLKDETGKDVNKNKGGGLSMFEKVLGNDGVIKFYKHIIGKIQGTEGLLAIAEETDIIKVKQRAYKALKQRGISFEDLNIFNSPKVDNYIIEDLVRDGLKKALGTNAYLFEDLKNKYPDIYTRLDKKDEGDRKAGKLLDDKEARYAVEWAFSMAYWTGINAKNDCKSIIGHDAWSKMINMSEYRLGQQKGKAAAGDYLTMFGWKKLSLDFFEGLNVSIPDYGEAAGDNRYKSARKYQDKTFLEFLQGGQGDVVDLGHFDRFEFKGNGSRKFLEDHVMNAWQVYKWVIEGQGINFQKMLNLDDAGYPVVNQEELNKIFRGFWKNLRYTYDMQEFCYGNTVRTWWKEKDKEGKWVTRYGSKKIEDTMFGEEIRNLKMYNDRVDKNGKMQKDDSRNLHEMAYRKNPDGTYDFDHKIRYARNIFAYILAKELDAHVHRIGGKTKYSSLALEKIQDFFINYPFGLDEGENHEVYGLNSFFTKKEMKEILKLGHSQIWKLHGVEALTETTGTAFESLGIFIKEFFKALLRG